MFIVELPAYDGFDLCKSIVILVEGLKLRMIGFDGVGRSEQESFIRHIDHTEVVIAVAAGDDLESDRL